MSIAVDATNVYWLNTDGGALMKLAKYRGAVTKPAT